MLLIKNARHFATGREVDIFIKDGKIARISENIAGAGDAKTLDAAGLVAAPGLVDMHVHFRDPGLTYKEDIITGAAAAAAGGVTTCACMPNTVPPADSPETIKYVIDKAKKTQIAVLPYGAATRGQKGEELTDFAALKAAGAVALSDDGNPIQNAALARKAMQTARKHDILIVSHCEDADMAQNHGVNEGSVSRRLDMPGRPAIAEDIMVARDIMLAAETGARVHIAHVSTSGAVDIIRRAKAAGINITAETCPQYFSLAEDEILTKGPLARVNPPLRTKKDVEAVIQGLADGAIDAIATDHAPHSEEEKSRPVADAPSGMLGLETSLALALTFLYHTGRLRMDEIVRLMSETPARILGLEAGKLAEGAPADIVLFDPNEKWTVEPELFKSKSRNTPFGGVELRGKVRYTASRGKIVFGH